VLKTIKRFSMKKIFCFIFLLFILKFQIYAQHTIEYFIDSDPGVGNAIPVTGNIIGDSIFVNTDISTDGLGAGPHLVCFRYKNDLGQWGIYEKKQFYVCSSNPIADFSINDICFGDTAFFVDLSTNTGTNTLYFWDFNNDGTFDSNTSGNSFYLYSTAGSHQVKLKVSDIYGCSSEITKAFDVFPAYNYSDSHSICTGDTFVWHGLSLSAGGHYYDSLQSLNGCDSIFSLNLVVNPVFNFSETYEICTGDTILWHGQSLQTGGYYYDSLQTIKGCDSIYSIDLVEKPIPATPIITASGDTLFSNTGSANQWYNQNGPIQGANDTFYVATANGDYFTIVTQQGCVSDTSNIISVVILNNHFTNPEVVIKTYPNPVSEELIINFPGNSKKLNFEIYNYLGQLIYKDIIIDKTIVKTINFPSGLYIIKFENGYSKFFIKD